MSNLFTPENISIESLKNVFDSAFINWSVDEDGDLIVKYTYRCIIRLSENKNRLTLKNFFNSNSAMSDSEKLGLINEVNKGFYYLKAVLNSNGVITIEYDISLVGGITAHSIVQNIRNFDVGISGIISADDKNLFA